MKYLKNSVRVVAMVLVLVMMLAFVQPIQANAANNVRVHYLTLNSNTLSVLVECNGKFGMIDSGEDTDYPSGKDSRYPDRAHITKGVGHEKEVLAYLKSVGVNKNNFEFYIGTHPHSDHIGSADEVIRQFKPKRVYTPEYKDSYISDSTKLWDNLYVYDRMIAAAKEVGAQIIQNFNSSNTTFYLGGSMKVSLKNYDTGYKTKPVPDANYFSLGVLLEANGKSVFVAGDINNFAGDEDALLRELGHVDVLTLGHHGCYGSNSNKYVTGLTPKMMILAGDFSGVCDVSLPNDKSVVQTLLEMGKKGVPLHTTGWYTGQMGAIIVNFNSSLSTNIPSNSTKTTYAKGSAPIIQFVYKNGIPVSTSRPAQWIQEADGRWWYRHSDGSYTKNGWEQIDGKWYFFDGEGWMKTGWIKWYNVWYYCDSTGAMQTGWVKVGGAWYYMNSDGAMQTGWIKDGGKWYYLNSSGVMQTGWIQLSGTWYYLYSDGSMAANTWVDGCYLNSSGAWVK